MSEMKDFIWMIINSFGMEWRIFLNCFGVVGRF